MRPCDFERTVLSAQIRLEDLGGIGSISRTEHFLKPEIGSIELPERHHYSTTWRV
jgi:hypothetical protein